MIKFFIIGIFLGFIITYILALIAKSLVDYGKKEAIKEIEKSGQFIFQLPNR